MQLKILIAPHTFTRLFPHVQGYLLTAGQPQPQDLPKLTKVRFELRLHQVSGQVADVNHSWGQTVCL